jgi:hypothetical protein
MSRVSHLNSYDTRRFVLVLMMAGLASLIALLPYSVSGRSLSTNNSNSISPEAAFDVATDVRLTSPEEGATFDADSNIEITAKVGGTAEEVSFFANDVLIGTDTTSPYSVTLNKVPAGDYTLKASASSSIGTAVLSAPVHISVVGAQEEVRTNRFKVSDFDGDGKTDIAVWRPEEGNWHISQSSDGAYVSQQWGKESLGDMSAPGDYDGDGKTDIAVWRRGSGVWYVLKSSDGSMISQAWGSGDHSDLMVQRDYDGDGKTDFAVFRPTDSTWYILRSTDGTVHSQQWGLSTDTPVPGDYDGDGKADLAVWRPTTGVWYVLKSTDGTVVSQLLGSNSKFLDVPVQGDYDGDGKTDFAVWRAFQGKWYIIRSSDGTTISPEWGGREFDDRPVPGDYDGDGKTDLAVWRSNTGFWYVSKSSDGTVITQQWGNAETFGDDAVSSAYIPR